jgi:hypothetical protein
VKNSLTVINAEELLDTNAGDVKSKKKKLKKKEKMDTVEVGKQASPVIHVGDLSPELLFTPQRFTRGLSRETGLSPQVFIDMSTKSPRKRLATDSVGARDKVQGSGKRKRVVEVKTDNLGNSVPAQVMAFPSQGESEARNRGKSNSEQFGMPTKRRRVLRGFESVAIPSYRYVESPGSQLQSASSQVSCPDYFSSENEEVFLSKDQEQFKYIDETTCGFSSDTSFSQKSRGTPSSHLLHSLSLSGVPTSFSHQLVKTSHVASNHSEDSRLYRHSSGSVLSGGSRLSGQDEESLEALSMMSENFQSPRKSHVRHQNLVDSNVPVSPSHHRVEALRKVNNRMQPSPSPQMEKFSPPHSSGPEQSGSEQGSPGSTKSVPRKYSPNITARALSHLLQSPILKSHIDESFDLCEQNDKFVNVETIDNCVQPETKRSSRRSLYRTKTKSAI